MIDRMSLLLEVLSVIICLHYLYGEKFKLDILTVSLISIDIIIMMTIKYYGLSKMYTVIIYPIIVIYCGLKFGFDWRKIIVNNILYMVILGGIQIVIAICYGGISNVLSLEVMTLKNKQLLFVNGGVLFIVLIVISKLNIYKLATYLLDKERVLVISLILAILLAMNCYINYKVADGFNGYQNLILFMSISFFFILAGQIGKYKIKSKEIETELKMQKLYADSFHNMIEDIRMRQHEFDNHISTIYSLHYTCDSYEKLVEAQNEYSHAIVRENRYNKLLKAGNPLIIGFLYGKFLELEKIGIEITYQISIEELNIAVPVFKMVEILGNLIKNAVEAMETLQRKILYVEVVEVDGEFQIVVRNKSKFIDYCEIDAFFRKGYSKKGIHRGLGLYNVKTICNEYSLNIYCENKILNDENWLCFTITNKKEANL